MLRALDLTAGDGDEGSPAESVVLSGAKRPSEANGVYELVRDPAALKTLTLAPAGSVVYLHVKDARRCLFWDPSTLRCCAGFRNGAAKQRYAGSAYICRADDTSLGGRVQAAVLAPWTALEPRRNGANPVYPCSCGFHKDPCSCCLHKDPCRSSAPGSAGGLGVLSLAYGRKRGTVVRQQVHKDLAVVLLLFT